jgi:hypothetical protein
MVPVNVDGIVMAIAIGGGFGDVEAHVLAQGWCWKRGLWWMRDIVVYTFSNFPVVFVNFPHLIKCGKWELTQRSVGSCVTVPTLSKDCVDFPLGRKNLLRLDCNT